ncbi:T9SS sorting signal type C domain-containing protein [Flavobacterium sp. Fl-77]|uniref:T9SS sorting signal type C domain-containing protein n=1 Tax=Flavobacterium flavipigmentatum TaxID=2893884 RepID=A0AAJ2VWR6_9FLAO|nr:MULTISPECIES: T9SS sorting signal type C domain-containing protein [unclassified Flavobacterium]MDX6180810.1 T9SS sorting signal type C domain-containing protein [Flavobacterium sp. Fl-33]MDX6184410.1 T9SS sorting signal type C domain-containing protein [Flavobacterium sp. Fl-77]UFH39519.1 T9SS sorting signal type C domain-containing protein [Flavobacterium sp. F-70]
MFKKLLLSAVLIIFISQNVQSQCGYGGNSRQSGTTQSICYNRENSATNVALVNFANVDIRQHVRVNVIQGLTYTFTTSATDYGFIKRLTLYDASGDFIVQGNASANNTGVSLNWTATYTGEVRVQFNDNANCGNSANNTVTITAAYTGGSNSSDSQTAEGTNSWIGHVYDFSNSTVAVPPSDANAFANYLGSFNQANAVTGTTTAFSQSYGGTDNCFAFTAGGTTQSFRTDTFAVRYRMTSTLVGCYMVTIAGDDGVRLYVDGVKVFDAWTQQSSTTYQNVLINLTGNSKLVFDYYEKNGSNVSNFSMRPVDPTVNTIVTTGPITRCSGTTTVLDGSAIAYVGSSTNPSIRFQWQSSTDNTNFTDITGAIAEDYTVPATTPTANTTVYYRRVMSGTNASACSYPSSSIAITTATAAVGGTVTGGTTICSGSTSGLLTLGGYTGNIVRWESSSNSFATITVINNTTPTYTSGPLTVNTQFRAVVQSGLSTCNTVNSNVTTVAVNATSVAGTVSANQSICSGSQPANITLTGNTGNIQWQVSTNNSTFSNIGGNSNTLTSAQMGALTATRYYRAVVTSGVCPSATSATVVVTVNTAVPAAPGAISGITPQCPALTGQVYSIAAVANATSYVWTVPTGWSITSGQGTTSVTVTTGNSSQSGNISVAAVNGCGTSTNQAYFYVNVSNPAPASAPVASAATSAQCEAVVANWSTVTNATGYYLDIATDNAFTNFVSGYNNYNIAYSTGSFFAGGLPGGTLYYRVRAYNSCGVTGNSNTIAFSTTGPVGGTVASAQTICSGTQPATLTLSGNTGTIIRWEKSSNAAFTSPVTINNTASTLTGATIGNLTSSTYFRAVVQIQSGSFCTAFSSAVLITVGDSGGTVAPSQTICSGTQPATLTLSSYSGTIVRWEMANNPGFSSPTTIANTTATLTGAAIGNLTATTYFRAVVQSGSCPAAFSNAASITVQPNTSVGAASSTPNVCAGTPMTTITHTTAGATGIGAPSGLPAGVTASWATNTITITGTPTVGGSYNYSIPLIGSCGPTVFATGTINVSGAAPLATAATSPNCNGFTANWSSVVNATSYVLTIAEDNAFTIPVSGYNNLNVGNVTTYVATGLTALKTYYYRVVAVSGCGNSAASNVISIEVKALLSTTWNGTSWDNSAPKNPNVNIIFNGNYNSSGDLSGCSCQVNSGTVNILNGDIVKLVNALKVSAGTLIFKDKSTLVQTTDVQNTGNIVYERNTLINRFDYTYYGSPVTGQTMVGFSPETLGDKFLTFDGANSKWFYENNANVMLPGKGYVIRGPQSFHDTNRSLFVARFTGIPNNGPVTGESVIAAKSYVVGNPYPSAIKITDFLAANPFLEGTVRFWTHNTNISPSGSLYVYTSTDYASCNATGGTAAQSGGVAPNGYIAAGQAIMVKVRAGESPSQIVFNNGMRKADTGNNSQFFKTGKNNTEAKVWLNFSNPSGVFKQALIGYVDGASNSYEDKYDGTTSNANTVADFYSLSDNKSLAIQGRAYPLASNDVVPLGYKSTIDGSFTIAIDHTEGDLDSQNVYLEDKVLNVVHDLKESAYTFTTAKGTFKERFALKYTNKTLGTGDFEADQTGVVVSVKDQVIKVSSASENIKTVYVYDLSGKLLYEKTKVNDLSLSIERLPSSNQMLLVKVVLDNDFETTKKIVF